MATARTPTAALRAASGAVPGAGWYPVARSSAVGTTPVPVGAGGRAYVVVRLRPGAEVTALSARCPHRLAPLTTATVVDGRLQCPFHGWQFNAEGRCVEIPSLGPHGTPPPRADLAAPWAVEERDGWVWLAPDQTAALRPPRAGGSTPAPEPVPDLPTPTGPVLGNLHPALEHAWHPVALSGELQEGGYVQVRLLGRNWTVHRRGGALDADPPAWGVVERHGVVWVAPGEPRDGLIEVPETGDPAVTASWLPPARSSSPAGPLADALLDAAHVPFVHAAAAGGDPEVPPVTVTPEPGGFTGGPAGGATYRYRAPFQLLRRSAEPGLVRATLFLLQPEDDDSTRVYTCVLLSRGDGTAVPADVVAAEVVRQQEALAEDLEQQAAMAGSGLPLLLRDELHVPADRLGVALRRALADLVADRAAADRAVALQQRATA